MPTSVVPIVMVIDTVVMPVAIPIISIAIESPTWPRKTWIHIPIWPIRIPIDCTVSKAVPKAISDVNVVANIDIRVVADARPVATDARSVDCVVDA